MLDTSPLSLSSPSPTRILLDERSLLMITGEEARVFLNNLVTIDVMKLRPGSMRPAALLTPQGKIIADFLLCDASEIRTDSGAEEQLFLLDVSCYLIDIVNDVLLSYRLRSKVEITHLPAPISVMICLNGAAAKGEDFYTFEDPRTPELGTRLYGPLETLLAATKGWAEANSNFYHARRISLGIAEMGQDFATKSVFPHEINLDLVGGVDFKKGCYIGQEVVSRMQHRGKTRTRLVIVFYQNGFGVSGGAEICAADHVVGSVGESKEGCALALIRLDKIFDAPLVFEKKTQENQINNTENEDYFTFKNLKAGGVAVKIKLPFYVKIKFLTNEEKN